MYLLEAAVSVVVVLASFLSVFTVSSPLPPRYTATRMLSERILLSAKKQRGRPVYGVLCPD